MKNTLLVLGILVLLALLAPTAQARYGDTNLIANPGYENEFDAWQNDGFTITDDAGSGQNAVTAIVVKGASATVCSKPYPSGRTALHMQVMFKAQGQATNFRSGRGTGIFFVRWLDGDKNYIGDTVHATTDNANKGWQSISWVNPYFDEDTTDNIVREWFQICAKAYAFGGRSFTLWVDSWSAEQ